MTESSRSRSYPAISLPEAVEVLRKQVDGLGWGAHDRGAIAQALGYTSGTTGVAARKISALAQFGLLQKQHGLYEPTWLARAILSEKDDNSLREALRTAFLHSPLFREVICDHLDTGRLPRLLAHTLRGYGIASNARDEVARILMDSAQRAGMMDASGNFEKDVLASLKEAVPAQAAASVASGEVAQSVPSTPSSHPEDGQVLRLYLTDGKVADLRLPLRLNDQDLMILRSQLDVLETQVQVNKPAPPLRWVSPRKDRSSQG